MTTRGGTPLPGTDETSGDLRVVFFVIRRVSLTSHL